MGNQFYRLIACTNRRRARTLGRPAGVRLRLAQLTDPHMPSDITLARRLRDLARPGRAVSSLPHELSAISNELSHPWRARRREYANLLHKALVGLHGLEVDHLLLTGDLAHCGLAQEFSEVRAILDVARWIGPERVTVIAGNHDRFNLYESIPSEPMEAFFDVVGPRKPRIKRLAGGLALVEIDSNADRDSDRPHSERWLPNTRGTIYPEAARAVRAELEARPARRVLILMHHHVSTDWYPRRPARDWGGFMAAADGVEALTEAVAVCDNRAPILHGHIHDVMPAGHVWRGRLLSNPGGFAEARRINLLDWNEDETFTLTQIELR